MRCSPKGRLACVAGGLALLATACSAGIGGSPTSSSAASTSGSTSSSGSSGNTGAASTSSSATTSSTGGSSGSGSTGAFTIGPHAAWPQVPNNGGPTLSAPAIVNITFQGYPEQAQMDTWAQWVASSSWLEAVGRDYGVGAGPAPTLAHLASAAPTAASDSEIHTLIEQGIAGGTLPPPSANTLYLLYFPASSTVTANGTMSCVGFVGYHSSLTTTQGQTAAYAVVVDCPGQAQSNGLSTLQETEAYASYALIEAATDPFSATPAWLLTDTSDPWSYSYGEVADMCIQTELYQDPSGNVAQRSWSNSAAIAGTGSPCVPAPTGESFFAASGPSTLVSATAGQTVQITLQGWSSGPVPVWTTFLYPWTGTIPNIGLSPGYPSSLGGMGTGTSIGNGESATFSVTVPSTTPSQSYEVLFAWTLQGTLAHPGMGDTLWWPVVVYVP